MQYMTSAIVSLQNKIEHHISQNCFQPTQQKIHLKLTLYSCVKAIFSWLQIGNVFPIKQDFYIYQSIFTL